MLLLLRLRQGDELRLHFLKLFLVLLPDLHGLVQLHFQIDVVLDDNLEVNLELVILCLLKIQVFDQPALVHVDHVEAVPDLKQAGV